MATTTDQEILDAAKAKLLRLLTGSAEWREGNHSSREHAIKDVEAIITAYEERVNASSGSVFKRIC